MSDNKRSNIAISNDTKAKLTPIKGEMSWDECINHLLENQNQTESATDLDKILQGTKTEFFVNTKENYRKTLSEKLQTLSFTTGELLTIASEIMSLDPAIMIKQAIDIHTQKIVTNAFCTESNRGSIGSADPRIVEAFNRLFIDLINGKIETITVTKLSQLSTTNFRSTKSFLQRYGLTELFKQPLSLTSFNSDNWQALNDSGIASGEVLTSLKPKSETEN